MKTIVPDYYAQFRCIAGACQHSCCIGWEIDIDPDSLARFDAVPGDLGTRLQAAIDRSGDTPHFILADHDRCPFLNDESLCDLILGLGEDSLCQICADHPRFRNDFSHRTELGLGLCCEAAAELILTRKAPMQLLTLTDDGEEASPDQGEAEFFRLRDNALAIAQDRDFSVAERMEHLATFFGLTLPEAHPAHWMDVYLELERLDEGWTDILHSLSTAAPTTMDSTMYEQLLVYLLYRQLPTAWAWGDIAAGVWFAILSTRLLMWLDAANPEAGLLELARMYSGEIEYSDENLEILMNLM